MVLRRVQTELNLPPLAAERLVVLTLAGEDVALVVDDLHHLAAADAAQAEALREG